MFRLLTNLIDWTAVFDLTGRDTSVDKTDWELFIYQFISVALWKTPPIKHTNKNLKVFRVSCMWYFVSVVTCAHWKMCVCVSPCNVKQILLWLIDDTMVSPVCMRVCARACVRIESSKVSLLSNLSLLTLGQPRQHTSSRPPPFIIC